MTLAPGHITNPPHIYASYRVTDRTDGTPANAIFVARNARMADFPDRTSNPHNKFDYSMTKYFTEGRIVGSKNVLTQEHCTTDGYTYKSTNFDRTPLKWPMTLGRFERLLDDAVEGVRLAKGREINEMEFADGRRTIAVLDSIKASELLVQTVREGKLFTKVIDQVDLDPELARMFKKLKA